MDDLISRSAALEAVGDVHPLDYNGQAILHRIQQLPSAEKRGKWICVDNEKYAGGGYTMCLACKQRFSFGGYNLIDEEKYCPNCGARMKEGEDETD